MRRFTIFILLLLCGHPAAAEERFIVRLRSGDESVREFLGRLGLKQVQVANHRDMTYVVSTPDSLPQSVVDEMLGREPRIRAFEREQTLRLPEAPDSDDARERAERVAHHYADSAWQRTIETSYTRYFGAPSRRDYVFQSASRRLRLHRVHDRFGSGRGIVAVIDTGVDESHPTLRASLVPGYDFVHEEEGFASEWSDLDATTAVALQAQSGATLQQSTVAVLNQSTVAVLDQALAERLARPEYRAFGHGTLVAGLVHLVAPSARIMPLKAFRGDGTASTADIVAAVYYAVEHGADVINMSFSFEVFSPELMRAVNYATRKGVLCVAAAGNMGEAVLVYPASFQNVTGVAASTSERGRSEISNHGADLVSVATLGEEVVSLYPGGNYASVFGTSFSAALVAGAASLLRQEAPTLDQSGLEAALAKGRSRTGELGYGELDLLGSLVWLRREDD